MKKIICKARKLAWLAIGLIAFGASQAQSRAWDITITVPPPEPEIAISPLADFLSQTNPVVIAPDNQGAMVVLDSSGTGLIIPPTQFTWLDGSNLLSTTEVTTNFLTVGTHQITLEASDDMGAGQASVTLEIVTPGDAAGVLITMVEQADLGNTDKRRLLASLLDAEKSFDRGEMRAGANRLRAFLNEVKLKLARVDPADAALFTEAAQEIFDSVEISGKHFRF